MLRSALRTSLPRPALNRLPTRSLQRAPLLTRPLSTSRSTYPGCGSPLCPLAQLGKTYIEYRAAEVKHPRFPAAICITTSRYSARYFHHTPPVQALPMLPLIGLLKTSTALELVRTAARIALTFLPIMWFKNMRVNKMLKKAEASGDKEMVEKIKAKMAVKRFKEKTIFFNVLLFIPVIIFWLTILASMERTPLTGRWRLILLSPEEEEEISSQLAGAGWYKAVADILSQEEGTTPALLPPNDWRMNWVRDTLRQLESVIPLLQREHELEAKWLECEPEDVPLPPPADFPLRPRPRASEMVRNFAELSCGRRAPPSPHGIPGPPYSLVVVDKPGSSNAFSYGFGPDGGGGIVVFSGFIDDVLRKHPFPEPPAVERSWWSSLLGLPGSSTPRQPPTPTREQTEELAILLAHELSHLILSHHLETLSSGSIIWPGVISIMTDVVRAVMFPVTMLFGPFVNDALAGVGKLGSGQLTELTQYCTSQKQEVEADVVSARLLAHAGFDPRAAVRFWEDRQETERTAECSPKRAQDVVARAEWERTSLPMRWVGNTHPMHVVRVERLKAELHQWEIQREAARLRLRQQSERLAAQRDG
ncbi:peptidase family M48-domain-containing protein [Phanerochaete sordida]|uniref:Peptidase family M48-domain-containing protein n=1 Tax=Phanerochaete sordida TaxID=48140 RepID=A0A9P3G716_9APHY|nr:peptidase family M48-domain-containing protein [Phanerochaete sordida]